MDRKFKSYSTTYNPLYQSSRLQEVRNQAMNRDRFNMIKSMFFIPFWNKKEQVIIFIIT